MLLQAPLQACTPIKAEVFEYFIWSQCLVHWSFCVCADVSILMPQVRYPPCNMEPEWISIAWMFLGCVGPFRFSCNCMCHPYQRLPSKQFLALLLLLPLLCCNIVRLLLSSPGRLAVRTAHAQTQGHHVPSIGVEPTAATLLAADLVAALQQEQSRDRLSQTKQCANRHL